MLSFLVCKKAIKLYEAVPIVLLQLKHLWAFFLLHNVCDLVTEGSDFQKSFFSPSSLSKGCCSLEFNFCLLSISVWSSVLLLTNLWGLCLLSPALQTSLFVPGNKRRVLPALLIYCSDSSFISQHGMKFVVLSIPETSCQQPCEVNKDVLKTALYNGEI